MSINDLGALPSATSQISRKKLRWKHEKSLLLLKMLLISQQLSCGFLLIICDRIDFAQLLHFINNFFSFQRDDDDVVDFKNVGDKQRQRL